MADSSHYRGNSSGTHGYEEPTLVRTDSPLRQFAPGVDHKNWDTYDKRNDKPRKYGDNGYGTTAHSQSSDDPSRLRRSYSALGGYGDTSGGTPRYSFDEAAKTYNPGRSSSSLSSYGDQSGTPFGHQYRSKYARDWEHAKRMGRPFVKPVPEEPFEVVAPPHITRGTAAEVPQESVLRKYGITPYPVQPISTMGDETDEFDKKQADVEHIMRKYLGDREVDQRNQERQKMFGNFSHAADKLDVKNLPKQIYKDNSKPVSQAEAPEHRSQPSSSHPTISALGGMSGNISNPLESQRLPSYLRHRTEGIPTSRSSSRVEEHPPSHRSEYSPPSSRLSQYTVPEQELPSGCRSPDCGSETSGHSTPLPMPPPPPKYDRRMKDGLPYGEGTPVHRNVFTDPTPEELEELQSLHSFSRSSCSPEHPEDIPDCSSPTSQPKNIPEEKPWEYNRRRQKSPERVQIPIHHGPQKHEERKPRDMGDEQRYNHQWEDKRHRFHDDNHQWEDKRHRFHDDPRGFFESRRRRSSGGSRRRRLVDLLDLGGGWGDLEDFFDRPSLFERRRSLFDDDRFGFFRRRNTDAGRYGRYDDHSSSEDERGEDKGGPWKQYTTTERVFKQKERERTSSPGAAGSPRSDGTPVKSPDGPDRPVERERSRVWTEREVKRREYGSPNRKDGEKRRESETQTPSDHPAGYQERPASHQQWEQHQSEAESDRRSHGFDRKWFERRSSLPTDSLKRIPTDSLCRRPLHQRASVHRAPEEVPVGDNRRQSLFDNYRFKFGSFGTFRPYEEEPGVEKDTLRFQDFDDLVANVYEAQERVRHEQAPGEQVRQEECKEEKVDEAPKKEGKEEESKSDHVCNEGR